MTMTAVLNKKLAAIRKEHRRRWRQWAADLAADKPAPKPDDVIETAGHLDIADPGDALTADAEALRTLAAYQRNIELCHTSRADELKGYNGDLTKLRAAADAAHATWKKLHDLYNSIEGNASEGYWSSLANQLRRTCPRLFDVEDQR